ncbi:MAG: hypothetical protein COV47_02330 [Candidatus Diapherotrites archaeon CG11_big_fil_rev_8_21_14_0_20_37_9]|nr:MAG: hypothetical protein COV47_02330 [Candidatus Diapherotrites archaeon CG11_big_fil_rev_8_21_14_0_20_37_9]
MNLNLIKFASPAVVEKYSVLFKDDCVILCADFTEQELREINSKKRKFKTNFYSCKLISKKDNAVLQKFRKLADFIAVDGSSIEMNSWAANQGNVILLQPFGSGKNYLDFSTCNLLKQSNVVVAFLFNDFLNSKGFFQSQLFKNAMFCLGLLEKSKVPFFFASGAENEFELRVAKDLASVPFLLGIKKESAVRSTKSAIEILGVGK